MRDQTITAALWMLGVAVALMTAGALWILVKVMGPRNISYGEAQEMIERQERERRNKEIRDLLIQEVDRTRWEQRYRR